MTAAARYISTRRPLCDPKAFSPVPEAYGSFYDALMLARARGRRPLARSHPLGAFRAGDRRGTRDHLRERGRRGSVGRSGQEDVCGGEGDIGKKMGLANDWTVNLIRSVGNYGELYARNLG